MEITKDTIMYRGKDYPCVSIELTEEESGRHFESQSKTFADVELWDAIPASGKWEETDMSDGENDVDSCIDFYMDDQTCARFYRGEIPVNEMKVKVARAILSWQGNAQA